jgi:hypothetical protein
MTAPPIQRALFGTPAEETATRAAPLLRPRALATTAGQIAAPAALDPVPTAPPLRRGALAPSDVPLRATTADESAARAGLGLVLTTPPLRQRTFALLGIPLLGIIARPTATRAGLGSALTSPPLRRRALDLLLLATTAEEPAARFGIPPVAATTARAAPPLRRGAPGLFGMTARQAALDSALLSDAPARVR